MTTSDPYAANTGGPVNPAREKLVQLRLALLRLHKELLDMERREYERIAQRGPIVNAVLDEVSRLRTFTLAREGYLRLRGVSSDDAPRRRPILPTEVEALLRRYEFNEQADRLNFTRRHQAHAIMQAIRAARQTS